MRPQMAEDITIAHLVYQSLSGIAQWLFGRTDRTGKEAQIALEAWVTKNIPARKPPF